MSLATKYRPKTFDEFLDNEVTKQSIKSLLDREVDRPHVFLLTGPKGCGKTSLARIMAEYIGCHPRAVTEINFSDTRGIDTARDLIEVSDYLPRFGPVKVTIIDEFHQGTKDAFNALLKLFEEPPEASYFFLCTTDPQKIIPTIKDRCYIYTLEYLGSNSLSNLLSSVVKSEKKKVSKNIIEKIVEKSDGSARNALIMLDKIIDIPFPDLKQIENLMEEEDAQIKELCQLLLKKGAWKKVAEVIKKIKQEPESIRYAIRGYMDVVLLNSGSAQAALILECFKDTFFYTGKSGVTSACYSVLME